MDAFVNALYEDPKSPVHLKDFLMDNVNSGDPAGLALFDVILFAEDLADSWPTVHEKFGEDGTVFRQLSGIVVLGLQKTHDYAELQQLVFNLSHALEPHKDEHGYVDVCCLTVEQATHFVTLFNREQNTPKAKEFLE